MSRCPEAVIVTWLRETPLVIQCDRDGGHEGNHAAKTERGGDAEWSRIAGVPTQLNEVPF